MFFKKVLRHKKPITYKIPQNRHRIKQIPKSQKTPLRKVEPTMLGL